MLSGADGTSDLLPARPENRLLRVREACQSSLALNNTEFCLSPLLMGHGDLSTHVRSLMREPTLLDSPGTHKA